MNFIIEGTKEDVILFWLVELGEGSRIIFREMVFPQIS